MSLVSDFVQSMATQAFAMIGAETITINGTAISCVLAEVEDSKDFATGGFDPVKRLQAVCKTSDLPVGSILKKAATARSQTFRVEEIRKGGDFTTIVLEQVEKS